jgi:hypothetical protein
MGLSIVDYELKHTSYLNLKELNVSGRSIGKREALALYGKGF